MTAPARNDRPRLSRALMMLRYMIEAAPFLGMMALFRALGVDRASALGGWIARTIGPRTPINKRAVRNLRLAFPGIGQAEIDAICREMWENLGRTFGEYPHFDKFDPFREGGRVEVNGLEHVEAMQARNTGAIFFSGHFGNWELMPKAMTGYGFAGGEVYRAPNNPFVDRWLVRQRSTHICPVQIAKGAKDAKQLITLMREKQYVAMLLDQKMNDGIAAPFFGHEAMTAPAAAYLSVRYGVPMLPAYIERTGGAHFKITVFPPLDWERTGDRNLDIYNGVLAANRYLEERIRARPGNWLWLHNRWPKETVKKANERA